MSQDEPADGPTGESKRRLRN